MGCAGRGSREAPCPSELRFLPRWLSCPEGLLAGVRALAETSRAAVGAVRASLPLLIPLLLQALE